MTQTDKAAVDVLPCPFCGAVPDVSPASGGTMASCDDCMIDMLVPRWNCRAAARPQDADSLRELQELRAGRDAAMNEIGILRRENVRLMNEVSDLQSYTAFCRKLAREMLGQQPDIAAVLQRKAGE